MAIFKVKRFEQVKIWQECEITFEAESEKQAMELLLDAKNKDADINSEIIDWGDCEICFETEIATGNYQWTDKQISQLVEMDE
tara:strand:+ start:446 stop:694 length:249 start_codon:yes stop_codon:yes gene_type:complete